MSHTWGISGYKRREQRKQNMMKIIGILKDSSLHCK
jgi:hypothetical protein